MMDTMLSALRAGLPGLGVTIPAGADEDTAWAILSSNADIMANLEGKQIIKKIYRRMDSKRKCLF